MFRLSMLDILIHDWLQDYLSTHGRPDEPERPKAEKDDSENSEFELDVAN